MISYSKKVLVISSLSLKVLDIVCRNLVFELCYSQDSGFGIDFETLVWPAISHFSEKQAPKRPPPPKLNSNRASTSPIAGPTEPHAVVRYPYKSAHSDELSCQPDDVVILKKEVCLFNRFFFSRGTFCFFFQNFF